MSLPPRASRLSECARGAYAPNGWTQPPCCGPAVAEPVLLVHGNISTSVFWRQTMLDLAPARRSYAPDLRGFSDSEPLGVDATRGLADYADDLASLLDTLGLRDGDRSADSGASPRNVMNATYFRPPFRAADEDAYVEAMLSTRIGEDHYPGDAATSAN